MVELYRNDGLTIYEEAHYSQGEDRAEVAQLLQWYGRSNSRILDLGCSGGLHALELARQGHRVVGVDCEASAVDLARQRAAREGLAAEFHVIDLEEDALDPLGSFDLIYSIGNVLSHLTRIALAGLFKKLPSSFAPEGILLFDLLSSAPSLPKEVREDDLGIVWKRQLDPSNGRIELQGIFTRSGVTESFQLWGYTVPEVVQLLQQSGFHSIDVASTLDFPATERGIDQAVSLKFRAQL